MAEMLYGNPVNLGRLSIDSGVPLRILRDVLGIETAAATVLDFKK
jgi:hypothetical protein